MQRLLSLATIALIVGTGWMLLREPSPSGPNGVQGPVQTGYSGAPVFGGGPGTVSPMPLPSAPAQAPVIRSQPASAVRAGGQSILIASYNVQVFGKSKEQKLPVMQTLASVMRNFDLIAIQEIRIDDNDLLRRFLGYYLNPISGRNYDYVLGPRLGRSNSKEQYAFIFDTARIEVNPNHVYTVRDPDDLLHREPFVAMFRTRGPSPQEAFTFVLVDVHTDPDEVDTELNDLAKVYQAVRVSAGGEDDVILLGDLNVDDRNLGELGRIPGIRALISGIYTNTRQTKQFDNILIHSPSTTEFVGRAGVFDTTRQFNLRQEDSLQVSDHFPVWAEFSVYESAVPGRVASRPR